MTGNVSGTAATVTGAAQTNITSVGTLTGLAISGDLTLDSAGAVVYDKSEQALTFGDNHKAKFGTGADLQIYHSGTESRIDENGVGNLKINANNLEIYNSASSEAKAKFNTDGAVELYHDNSKKFETTATGASITGLMASTTATADSATIGNLAVTNLVVSSGDSATFTNLAVSTALNTNSLIVDDITINSSTISDAGTITIDANHIDLDADGGNITFKDGGTEIGQFQLNDTNHFKIGSKVSDADIRFFGNDGGSTITALILDMSEAGKATFNSDIITSGTIRVGNLNVDSADLITLARSNISGRNGLAYNSSTGVFDLDSANAITTVKNALSTGHAGLTYDSAAGQFGLNANHVMALIQTVDSNGSGLNADTLEGQAGSHYRINVYNASGTLLN